MSVQNQLYPRSKIREVDKVLETIFEGDQERIEYIQKLVGISLTGKADFQAIIFYYGDGRNGNYHRDTETTVW